MHNDKIRLAKYADQMNSTCNLRLPFQIQRANCILFNSIQCSSGRGQMHFCVHSPFLWSSTCRCTTSKLEKIRVFESVTDILESNIAGIFIQEKKRLRVIASYSLCSRNSVHFRLLVCQKYPKNQFSSLLSQSNREQC